MAEPAFEIRLTDIKPADLTLGELGNLLRLAQDAILTVAASEFPEIKTEQIGLSLQTVKEGSVGLPIAARLPSYAIPAFDKIWNAVFADKWLDLTDAALDKLDEFQRALRKHNTGVEFYRAGAFNGVRAALAPSKTIPRHPRITTSTTVFGEVIRVGGDKPAKAVIRTTAGEVLYCEVNTKHLARLLGNRLYELVGLQGVAQVSAETLRVLDFKIENLTEYTGRPIDEAFSEIRDRFGHYFDDVDPDAFVAELRH